MELKETDVLIIGSGIAGLYAAHLLSEKKEVTIVTKGKLENSNSILAQGGIAAAIDKNDNWQNHYDDTLVAGNFHNNEESTRELVKNAPLIIQQLIDLGVPFDRNIYDELDLGQEGGHHRRRIVHAGGDSTGKEVINTLISKISDNVKVYEEEMIIDLIINEGECVGALSKNKLGNTCIYKAKHTVLATGGIGGIYSLTSNDPTVTGDGIAIAYRAGAELIDLEFIQFHPTMLVKNDQGYGLVSEAVRGEGAKLINEKGQYIMKGIHPLKDLAPRDIVSRRIFDVEQNGDKVYLDISMIKNFNERFPTITKICEDNHINIKNGLLPISPGAHFLMGGIKTNVNGETNIKALYAIGEVASTGVHGANRLASNSLLEGVVFANKLTNFIISQPEKNFNLFNSKVLSKLLQDLKGDSALSSVTPAYGSSIIKQDKEFLNINKKDIQSVMTKNVGIVRNEATLLFAKEWLEQFLSNEDSFNLYNLSTEQITKLNMIIVGWLITTSALKRTESRGGHYRIDYPNSNEKDWLKRYIVRRRDRNESYQIKNAITTAIC